MENPKNEKKPGGSSIYTIFLLGMLISSIQNKLYDFFDNKLGERFMLEDLKIKIRGESNQVKDEEKINNELEDIKKVLISFNEEIKDINENVLGKLSITKQIVLLNVDYLSKIIKEKLAYPHESEKKIDLVNKTFNLSGTTTCLWIDL